MQAQAHADCVSAMDICKKQSYSIDKTGGEGNDRKEADFVSCFMNGENFGQAEENSTWIKFEVKQSGSLAFTITPHRKEDDIDFVVFKLPSDGDCTKKQIVRCMAAGDTEGDYQNSRCMGKTGLKDGEKDSSEDAGCADADDNTWLAPLKVKSGEKYVVLVSNVSSRGPGFDINFYGSAMLPCDEEKQIVATPPKKDPKPKIPSPKKDPVKPAVVNIPPPAKIGDRDVRVVKEMNINAYDLTIAVWDSQVEDGDVISLYVNEKKIISNIRLTKKPQEFLIKIPAEQAYITVYAEDFGKAEPNTATVLVKDGVSEQVQVLKSAKGFQESIKVTKAN
jgi:hypothetical protein